MAKYRWHVTVKGRDDVEVVRHYKWVTKLYRFIARSHRFLGGKELTIYRNGRPYADIHYNDVIARLSMNHKEGEERKYLMTIKKTD
ncbi:MULTISPECIES: hypothetical protein [Enterococcus]|uniref:hypothetical protein n=1 Tax=Enterococcus TaxID=1350 RepID=UPI002953AEB4|nr:hypothetical protein [Enterococcus gallinarum]